MTRLNRRRFLFTAGTAAASTVFLHACSQNAANTSPDAGGSATPSADGAAVEGLETTTAKLGFIALTDSAPLIIAKVKGFLISTA